MKLRLLRKPVGFRNEAEVGDDKSVGRALQYWYRPTDVATLRWPRFACCHGIGGTRCLNPLAGVGLPGWVPVAPDARQTWRPVALTVAKFQRP